MANINQHAIFVCNRTGVKSSRNRIEGVDFTDSVEELKTKVAKSIDFVTNDFDLIYAGLQLKDKQILESYGVRPGVTIHAVRKRSSERGNDDNEGMADGLMTSLQSTLLNPTFRSIVQKFKPNPSTIDFIVSATPGLDKDPVSLAFIQDPELLLLLAEQNNVKKVVEKHPCLSQALMHVVAAMKEEKLKMDGNSKNRSARGTYSLDQMSDDEDELRQQDTNRQPSQQLITASQLAAALSAATGSLSTEPNRSTSGEQITTDFLQQAMESAAGTSSSSSGQQGASQNEPANQTSPAVTESRLQQLRDMGITDNDVAVQALEASGGDIQAALEIIFGENLFPQ